jgi:hypothetical protein
MLGLKDLFLCDSLLREVLREVFLPFLAWICALYDLVEKYYKNETRVPIRVKALSVLMDTYKSNRHIYEEDLVTIKIF